MVDLRWQAGPDVSQFRRGDVMHAAAFKFVSQYRTHDTIDVIEIGSRDVNGTIRGLFPSARWIGLDMIDGPCVDVVCDAATYTAKKPVDLVICCEVFEHAANWPQIIDRSFYWLKRGGKLIVTCAAPGRNAHSAIDGGDLRPGEHYANVPICELVRVAVQSDFAVQLAEQKDNDSRMMATRK